MSSMLLAGVHYVNRLGYYVCESPWDDEFDSALLTVAVECECYSKEGYEDGEHGAPDCEKCEGYGYVAQEVKDVKGIRGTEGSEDAQGLQGGRTLIALYVTISGIPSL